MASTAPRSHKEVPSPCAQPKLKPAIPAAEGVTANRILRSGTLPPVVQASTAHCSACPRSRLDSRGATPTQTLTCAVVSAVKLAVVDAAALVLAEGVGDAVVGVGDVVVWVGVGVAGTTTGSHVYVPGAVVAVTAAALSVVAARTPPEAAVTSTLPAAIVTAVRRARAKPISISARLSAGLSICPLRRLSPHIEPQSDEPATLRPL
mgnify:CR=1 FL=1